VVDYVQGESGTTLVKVICDACGKSGASDTLMDAEFCALIGWTFDFGAVLCLLCQAPASQGLERRL
jgi:hypothetical protein